MAGISKQERQRRVEECSRKHPVRKVDEQNGIAFCAYCDYQIAIHPPVDKRK